MVAGQPGTKFKPYEDRDALLLTLGFSSYGAYQRSQLWHGIREKVRARSGGLCECCKERPSSQVHHFDYSAPVMKGETIEQLIDLCAKCHVHAEIIFSRRGNRKRSFVKSQRVLRRRMRNSQLVDSFCAGCGKAGQRPPNSFGGRPKCECGGRIYRVVDPATSPVCAAWLASQRIS